MGKRNTRIWSLVLTLAMLLGMLPTTALAAASEDGPEQIMAVETVTIDTSDADLPDNDELLDGYVQQMLYPEYGGTSLFGNYGEQVLSDSQQAVYDALKGQIQAVAINGGSTTFFPLIGTNDITNFLSLSWETTSTDTNQLKTELKEQFGVILDCLMVDCPYELYWYDKVGGMTYSNTYPSGDGTTASAKIGNFVFQVAQEYQDNNLYRVNASKASAAATAIENADKIVGDYAGKSDYDKLLAYKDEICERTEYNRAAADNDNTPYGDPWQMIYVFDDNPDTTVVCEGYSKAFQYLCDKSTFTNAQCYTISGQMDGGTGAGGHMWNVVTLDGNNYLVDVTNSDSSSIGQDGELFLAGTSDGNVNSGYTFSVRNQNVLYTYDTDIIDLYGESILTLSNTSYQQTTQIDGEVTIEGGDAPKIGEPLTVNVTASNTDGAVLQYQWYRGDMLIADETGEIYTPNDAADVGKTIKVVVTADGYSGTLEASTEATVAKADGPEAPAQPQATATHDTITVIDINKMYEYACVASNTELSEKDWQDSGEFTGLISDTTYQIYARVAATDTTSASDASPALEITTKATSISEVTMEVAAPVKNGIPATNAQITVPISGVTVSKVEWLQGDTAFSENKFAGGTVYTVKITLTATGKSFADSVVVMLNGGKVDDVIPSDNMLVITKTFSATEEKIVEGIQVTVQPNKTAYVEGENFDKTGMVVTATYDDGTTNDDFTDYTVENGDNLKKGATSVTIKVGDITATIGITVKGVLKASDFDSTVPADLTYNGQPKTAQVVAKDGVTGIGTITVKYNNSTTEPANVGTYKVTFDVAEGGAYAAATGLTAGDFTIAKATPTITANDLTVPIGAAAIPLNASIDPSHLTLSYKSANERIATVDSTGHVTGVELGEATITVSCLGDTNYNAVQKSVNVKVTDKTPIEVTFSAKGDKTYIVDGYVLGDQFNEATVGDGTDVKTVKYRYNNQEYDSLDALKAVTVKDVGTYTVTAYYESETEYGEASATFQITKANQNALTIRSANTVTFGETLQLTTSGGSGDGVVTYVVINGTGSATINGDVLTPTKAGTVQVIATKAEDDSYKEVTSEAITITINKADASDSMKTASGTVVAGMAGSVTLPTLPAGATYGTVSLGVNTTNDHVANPIVRDGKLIYTGGGTVIVGTLYTITIEVNGGDNYSDYTITVALTGSNKITPTLTVHPIHIIYTGQEVPVSAITGTAKDGDKTISGTWSWGAGKAVPKNVSDSGSYEVIFTPDDAAYASGTVTVQVLIDKATPTGEPKYTTISTSGKTLQDADLTTTGGTFSVPGTVAWEQAVTTEVAANTTYQWIFTPTDTANYNTLTGSVTLWQRSSSSSSSSSSSNNSSSVSQPSTSGGTSTVTMEVNASTSGSTANASVSTSMNTAVYRALNAAKKNDTDPVVAISIDMASRADSVRVSLPTAALKTLGQNADALLTVVSDVAEVKLNSDAIRAVASQAGSMVTLYVVPVTTSELNSRQQQAVGNAPVFDLSFKSGSTIISEFDGGCVTVTLPYTLQSHQTAEGIVVWYMDNIGNLVPCDTTYHIGRQEVTFTTTHFSKYVIGYEEKTWSNPYSDVQRGAWYYDAVQFVADKGLMTGTETTCFSPDEITNRAMLVTILWRQAGSPSSNNQVQFRDVDPSQWYGSAVRWAAANQIVAGYGDGTFGPNDAITREQMTAILYRYAQYKSYPVSATGSLNGYTDANRISDYATTAFRWICSRDIMSGTSATTLGPAESATRAQVAVILMRFYQEYNL